MHLCDAALLQDPLEDQATHVNRKCGRRVVAAFTFDVGRVAFHGVELAAKLPGGVDEIIADDDKRGAGDADVLLRTGVDQSELAHVEGARVDVAAHVADERNIRGALGIAEGAVGVAELRAVDGVVAAHVHICGRSNSVVDFAIAGAKCVLDGSAIPGFVATGEVGLGFVPRFFAPVASGNELGAAAVGNQVLGNHVVLRGCAACQKQNLVVGRNVANLSAGSFGFGEHLVEDAAPVAVLHDADAAAVDGPEVFLRLANDFFGKYAWACGVVESASGGERGLDSGRHNGHGVAPGCEMIAESGVSGCRGERVKGVLGLSGGNLIQRACRPDGILLSSSPQVGGVTTMLGLNAT